jgi:protein LTV1
VDDDEDTAERAKTQKILRQKLELLGTKKEETIEEIHDELDEKFKPAPRDKWDCESIVSTYSNLENHPTMIKRPRYLCFWFLVS